MAAKPRWCSLPECGAAADTVHSGHAYCAAHRRELNLVRVLATKVHRIPPKRRPVRERATHHDPRSDR